MTSAAPLPCYSAELAIYRALEDGLRAWIQHCNWGRRARTEAVSTCALVALAILRASTVLILEKLDSLDMKNKGTVKSQRQRIDDDDINFLTLSDTFKLMQLNPYFCVGSAPN